MVATNYGLFGEVQFDIRDQLIDGDKIATRWQARRVENTTGDGVMGISITRFDRDRIAESWDTWDMLSALQSGASPDALESLSLRF